MEPLSDSEKAAFDTIRQVATSPRPDDLGLHRMELDGREVAVVAQKVYESATAEFAGWMPLAVLLGDDEVRRLRDASGEPTRAVPAEGHEGAA